MNTPTVVHALLHGTSLCTKVRGVPRDWPEGHLWHRVEEPDLVTCAYCQVALVKKGFSKWKVLGIARKRKPREPMELLDHSAVSKQCGIEGDFRGGGGTRRKRQVTILSLVDWNDACRFLAFEWEILPWQLRRANLLLLTPPFTEKDLGKKFRIGEQLVLEITDRTDPCSRMNLEYPGLEAALGPDFRCGFTTKVITPGEISVGDQVRW